MTRNICQYRLYGLFFIAVLLVSGCGQNTVIEKTEAKPRPVKLIEVEQDGERESLSFPAVIDAVQSSRLAFQVSGQITQLNIIAAQEVKQGEVLAQLEQRDFVNNRDSARAQFTAAQSEYERAEQLSGEGVVSANELEKILSQRDIAKANLDSAEKALSDSILRAPYDAIVVDVDIQELENTQAGTAIIGLMGKGQMEAIINMPASIVATVNANTSPLAGVKLDAAPDTVIPATFRRANLEADTATQTYEARFAFTPPQNLNVLPGMNASLEISFFRQQGDSALAVSVPTDAIFSQGEEQFVWIVNPQDMTVSKRKVLVRDGIGSSLLITEGLEAGDRVVGAGASYLAEGMQVREWTKS